MTAVRPLPPPSSAANHWLLLAYALFVVYGSLVPLDFRPYALEQAWADFSRIPFLQLGIDSRADWVANGVLYAPLALLAARSGVQCGLGSVAAGVLAVLACSALAVGVEFTQLFFPPRTVSQNDIWAEGLGSVAGAVAAPLLAGWLGRLGRAWGGGQRLGQRLLEAYALGYLALCFFPFDLLLSAAELQAKADSNNWGWLLAPQQRGVVGTLLQLLVETALSAPLGALLGAWLGTRLQRRSVAAAGWAGAVLGLVIELGQFCIASGVSQGASVLTRALGLAVGAALLPRLQGMGSVAVRGALRRLALPALLLYMPLLCYVNGLFSHGVQTANGLDQAWAELRLLPFYYHYYTSEAVALVSLGSVALMYLPLAVLGWACLWPRRATLALVGVVAAGVEAVKLLLVGLHPDPTNVGIAVVAAAVALQLMALLQRPVTAAEPPRRVAPHPPQRLRWSTLPMAATLVLVTVQALLFPVAPPLLLAGLGAAAFLSWQRPWLPLALLPAALALLDLGPWSGRLFWDEFDMLSAVCLAVALHRTPAPLLRPRLAPGFTLLAISLLVSTAVALAPAGWTALAAGGFDTLDSPFNALRIAKGAVWAWLFVALWLRLPGGPVLAARCFTAGIAVGLAGSVLAVLWERALFAGVFDTAAAFRVSGLFSTMRTGGAFIECWLAVATAFVLAAALRASRWPLRCAALLLLAGAGYGVMVTYSRNGYAALGVVVLVALLSVLRAGAVERRSGQPSGRPARASRWAWAAAALVVIAAAAVPVALGPYASARLSAVSPDLALRQAHWRDGLAMRDSGWLASSFGMGLGRYPDTHYWRSQEANRAARYGLGHEGDTRSRRLNDGELPSLPLGHGELPSLRLGHGELPSLRLGVGARLYIDQIITTPPTGGPLTLQASLRLAPGSAQRSRLDVSLCEKWLLTTLRCVQGGVALVADPALPQTLWRRVQMPLDTTALLAGHAWWRPPLTLSLLTPTEGAIDIADLRLAAADGQDLLHNGSFARRLDGWSFTTDVDPPWQLHSLPLQVLFDQGWFGVLAWGLVLLGALGAGARLAWQGRALVPAALPALCGFLVSGTLNTLIDAPRFLGLLLVLAWLAAQPRPAPVRAPVRSGSKRG